MTTALNLPAYDYTLQTIHQKTHIWDPTRKRYVLLTPEEWVRQHVLHYLTTHLGYPHTLIATERAAPKATFPLRRADIIVYNRHLTPFILVECKAATNPISQRTLAQIAQYNPTQEASYLLITNGLHHCCFQLDKHKKKYAPTPCLPAANFLC